jgi:predicted unusual protein kinase regulating ubiquinone biosynthesis (AarF/ABC1/UbiB family)
MAKKTEGPPKTRLQRSKVIGEVAASVAGKKLKSEMQAAFLPSDERGSHRAKAREEMAALVFEGLSKLRGTALKLAQLFCADTGLLPEEYMRQFEQSHYQVPGLSPALVRGVLRRELKRDPEEIFASFEWTPAGAASLGQVHRAKLKDGREVAVKVQYPGMQESLASDVGMAKAALKPMLRTGLILSTIKQLEHRLMEEIDYAKELANMQWFRSQTYPFALHIPEPHPEFSSRRVLTMEWIDGVTLDRWITQAPVQEDVNKAAQTLFDLFVLSVFERRRFHSDANFGNFFVRPDGMLVLLDFGSITLIPEADAQFYKRLWFAQGQAERLVRDYQERGARTDSTFWDECAQPYIAWISRLTGPREFDFGAQPDFTADGFRLFTAQMFNAKLQEYSDQLTLAHRTLLGLFTLFTTLKAKIRLNFLEP